MSSIIGIIVEIALNVYNGGALVAATGSKVAERADKVGQAARRSALGDHLPYQISVLFMDFLFYRVPQGFAGELGKIVVSQVLEFQFVWGASSPSV